jgi:protein-L-isoaspartate(D-aspartate) O-methyltransferase
VLLIGPATAYTAALLSTRAHVDTTTGAEAINGVYTLIFIDGAVEYLPDSVIAATSENGRIVTGVIERGVTSLATGIVRDGKIALRSFADSEIVPLAAFARKKEFVF